MTSKLRPIWPVLTLFVSGGLLAGAHAFETFGGLTPCALCLQQREWHWGVVAVSIAAIVVTRMRPAWTRWAIVIIGLVLLGAAAMALYHVGVEQKLWVAQCDAGAIDPSTLILTDLPDGPLHPPRCDDIAWQMFGISMAGYNAIISLALALASFWVGITGKREP